MPLTPVSRLGVTRYPFPCDERKIAKRASAVDLGKTEHNSADEAHLCIRHPTTSVDVNLYDRQVELEVVY